MKAVKKIKLNSAMTSKAAKKIFTELQENKKQPQILFVGGCVRNTLLEEEVSDIDLATVWTPQEVTAKLQKAGIKVIPTGIKHGTVTAVLDGEIFQITTLRQDQETDGRHAKVIFTGDWIEDARRRDFTLNTLLADIKGNIYDPLKSGIKDLEKRKVVFVGDTETRIKEDYLRILRFFRFHAQYGKGRPDAKALSDCAKLSEGLKHLSKERVTQEVFKILLSPSPQILKTMVENKILKSLISPKANLNFLAAARGKKIEMMLLILANFSKSGTKRLEEQLSLSNKSLRLITEIVLHLRKFTHITDHYLKVLLYRTGAETAELVLNSRLLLSGVSVEQSRRWIKKLKRMERPVLPLRGQDLINRGMKPGPEIKKKLDRFERLWIKNGFK